MTGVGNASVGSSAREVSAFPWAGGLSGPAFDWGSMTDRIVVPAALVLLVGQA